MHLKCIIIISNNVYFAQNFFCDFIQQSKKSDLSQKSLEKLCQQRPLASQAKNNYIMWQNKYTAWKFFYDSMQQSLSYNYYKNFRKNETSELSTKLDHTFNEFLFRILYIYLCIGHFKKLHNMYIFLKSCMLFFLMIFIIIDKCSGKEKILISMYQLILALTGN